MLLRSSVHPHGPLCQEAGRSKKKGGRGGALSSSPESKVSGEPDSFSDIASILHTLGMCGSLWLLDPEKIPWV